LNPLLPALSPVQFLAFLVSGYPQEAFKRDRVTGPDC
jgi:hypothetical protein